ncbi:MAG TPA: toxin-antitoxin system YwqK family antitoxin [Pirellulales bacterium]|jgi:antitoxin component YwqK of YwqJK toxin-antitoxin module|nr:toxin-antitoxin system YwqK family antitoxin [Pirellulales bacterium]
MTCFNQLPPLPSSAAGDARGLSVLTGLGPLVIVLVLLLGGCDKTSTADTAQPPQTPVPAVQPAAVTTAAAEASLVPAHAVLESETVEQDLYGNGNVKRRRSVRRYSGDVTLNHGLYEEFYESGIPSLKGQYESGRRSGDWSFFFANGQLARSEHYEHGQLEGACTVFREDGTKSETATYLHNKKDGTCTQYDATGKQPLVQSEVRNGIANGPRVEFFPNGQKRAEGHFVDGKYDGVITEWSAQGKKVHEVEFKLGKKNGKEIDFNDAGQPTFTRTFENGHETTMTSNK